MIPQVIHQFHFLKQSHPARFQLASCDSVLTPLLEWSWHVREMPGHICQLYGLKPLQCGSLMIHNGAEKWPLAVLLGDAGGWHRLQNAVQMFSQRRCLRASRLVGSRWHMPAIRKMKIDIQPPPLANKTK